MDLSLAFEGEGRESCPPFFRGDWPRFGFGAKGIVEVDVKMGRSVLLTEAGVEALGGSHCRASCWTAIFCAGPSGWYGMNKSGAPDEEEDEGRAGAS